MQRPYANNLFLFHLLVLVCIPTKNWAEAEQIFTDPAASIKNVTLALPLTELLNNRHKKEQVTGTFTIGDQNFSVKVTPRGKSRLEKCPFPPLWLNFEKDSVGKTYLHDQNKIKLVTHCKRAFANKGYLAAEMLAYRLLNLFTPYSYRVQAFNVEYVNTSNNKVQSFPAFAIEHKKQLTARLGVASLKQAKISRKSLEPKHAALVSMFNYFLGNTDYSLIRGPDEECCHNTVPVQNDAGEVISLLYDYDSSGFVDPPYAVPAETLGLRRLTQRKYRGYCSHNQEVLAVREEFIAHKAEVLELIASFDEIAFPRAKKTLSFVQKFYATIESDKSFQRRVLKACRG